MGVKSNPRPNSRGQTHTHTAATIFRSVNRHALSSAICYMPPLTSFTYALLPTCKQVVYQHNWPPCSLVTVVTVQLFPGSKAAEQSTSDT
jgi:hypothetical protein